MPMMTSQILKSVGFTKTPKSKDPKKKHFSPNKKNYQLHIKGYFLAKNNFVVEVTFKKTEYLKTHELKNIHCHN